MNNDLISRQMAVDAICKEWCGHGHDECEYEIMMENGFDHCDGCSDVDAIMDLPSAQPKIIYCRDCKHHSHDAGYGRDWCNRMSGVFRVKPDDYCSFAERKMRHDQRKSD